MERKDGILRMSDGYAKGRRNGRGSKGKRQKRRREYERK